MMESRLGSLEGVDENDEYQRCVQTKKPMIGYNWQDGFISPWKAADESSIVSALRLLEPNVHDTLVDLGCGDGRILEFAAKSYSIRCTGVDLDADLLEQAAARCAQAGVSGLVTLVQEDLRATDLTRFTIIVMYLLPTALRSLEASLKSALSSGASLLVFKWELEFCWAKDALVFGSFADGFFIYKRSS